MNMILWIVCAFSISEVISPPSWNLFRSNKNKKNKAENTPDNDYQIMPEESQYESYSTEPYPELSPEEELQERSRMNEIIKQRLIEQDKNPIKKYSVPKEKSSKMSFQELQQMMKQDGEISEGETTSNRNPSSAQIKMVEVPHYNTESGVQYAQFIPPKQRQRKVSD